VRIIKPRTPFDMTMSALRKASFKIPVDSAFLTVLHRCVWNGPLIRRVLAEKVFWFRPGNACVGLVQLVCVCRTPCEPDIAGDTCQFERGKACVR